MDTFINVTITTDSEIQKLNRKHLKHDRPTDVLSFNIDETLPDGRYYLGDIIVSRETAERQALSQGHSVEVEISELIAHGVLHLQGVHHEGH
ncbi:MAG: rRNA maturation RNase YbeY [candidate division WWE3 bacterium]|nr:rRNA maturation RNase YbeY [candidate division WWE3 bacterium]